MKIFFKYWDGDDIISRTAHVKKAYINQYGSWVEYCDGTSIKVFFVVLISDRWYSEHAIEWFNQFGE